MYKKFIKNIKHRIIFNRSMQTEIKWHLKVLNDDTQELDWYFLDFITEVEKYSIIPNKSSNTESSLIAQNRNQMTSKVLNDDLL